MMMVELNSSSNLGPLYGDHILNQKYFIIIASQCLTEEKFLSNVMS